MQDYIFVRRPSNDDDVGHIDNIWIPIRYVIAPLAEKLIGVQGVTAWHCFCKFMVVGESPMKKKKILIVEDNPDLSKVLELLLKSPYETVTANNGEEAVDVAVTEAPDLIIMDLMMPEMNGFEATRLIRQVPKTRSIPIMAITAGLSSCIQEECDRMGFDDFMTKPFTYEQLIARVRKLLKQYGSYPKRLSEAQSQNS
ncbi:MAG: response regulator [Deltaproteobacteria bacterium]|nr:response regulator [Deltaproteobacteria bacterium]